MKVEPGAASPATILVVEDDVLVRSVIAAYLRDRAFDVIEANSADEAIRLLRTDVPVDVVFSDVNMPGSIDGLGLAQWLHRERPALPIILTSGAASSFPEETALGRLTPFLAKPYDHAELERHIRALLMR